MGKGAFPQYLLGRTIRSEVYVFFYTVLWEICYNQGVCLSFLLPVEDSIFPGRESEGRENLSRVCSASLAPELRSLETPNLLLNTKGWMLISVPSLCCTVSDLQFLWPYLLSDLYHLTFIPFFRFYFLINA